MEKNYLLFILFMTTFLSGSALALALEVPFWAFLAGVWISIVLAVKLHC